MLALLVIIVILLGVGAWQASADRKGTAEGGPYTN